jgi:hypothetical protein
MIHHVQMKYGIELDMEDRNPMVMPWNTTYLIKLKRNNLLYKKAGYAKDSL